MHISHHSHRCLGNRGTPSSRGPQRGQAAGRHRAPACAACTPAPQSASLSSVAGGTGAKAQTLPTAPGLASTLAPLCLSRGQLHQAPHRTPARATSGGCLPQLRPSHPHWQGRCHLAGAARLVTTAQQSAVQGELSWLGVHLQDRGTYPVVVRSPSPEVPCLAFKRLSPSSLLSEPDKFALKFFRLPGD